MYQLSLALRYSLALAVFVLLSLTQPATADFVIDDESKRLAFCGHTFAYAANAFLLQNNEGAAKVMLLQQARAQTSLFSLHYLSGKIAGDRVAAFKTEGRKAKPFFDAYPSRLTEEVDDCVTFTNIIASQQSKKNIQMWGKSFYQLVEELAAKGRGSLGI
jgi:hypothetical protein